MDPSDGDVASWIDRELAGSTFKDERLGRRLRQLLARMAAAIGEPLPLACQDWANTKAAYRFLSNKAVSEAEILTGHFRSTHGRVAATHGPVLVLQDTTEFSYRRARPERIGAITTAPSRRKATNLLTSYLTP
jgi:Transposase DNA-binding